jgi:integrase
MKLLDRQLVEGTVRPRIYIGHRPYKTRTGEARASATWYAEWSLDARKHQQALGTRNKQEAIRKVHAILSRLHDGQMPEKRRKVLLSDMISDYVSSLEDQQRAPKTVTKYRRTLGRLLAFATERHIRFASAFTDNDFWAFRRLLIEGGLASKTVYTMVVIVKQLFNWATRKKLIRENPIAAASPKKPANTLQPCFTPDQVEMLLRRAPVVDLPAYAFMAYAGLRIGEVRDLRWDDLLLDQGRHGVIFVRRGGSGDTTKSGRTRKIPINSRLRKVIDQVPRTSDLVITYGRECSPVIERKLLMALKALCAKCGFPKPEQYKLHTFRHAFASMCARHNISYKYALTWMGHKSSDVLDMYYTMFDDTAHKAIETIDYASRDPVPTAPAA